MLNPIAGLDPIRSRQSNLLEAAEHDRLVQRATADAPHLVDRALLRAGDVLVGSGLRLYAWGQVIRFRRHTAHAL